MLAKNVMIMKSPKCKRQLSAITCFAGVIFLSGCSSYTVIPTSESGVTYHQGASMTTSEGSHSTVMLMPAYRAYEGSQRLTFVVGIRNDSLSPFEVNMANVAAVSSNGTPMIVHSYESVSAELRKYAAWGAVSNTLGAVSDGLEAGEAGTTTSTFDGDVRVVTGDGSQSSATYSGNVVTNDPAKAVEARNAANKKTQDRIAHNASVLTSAQNRVNKLLQRTTIAPGQLHEATIMIGPPDGPQTEMVIQLNAGGDTHEFRYEYKPR